MPAVSKQQQQFMGIVHAIQKGEMKPSEATPAARAAAKSMKKKDVEDFAATKHKGLPEEVPENEGIDEVKSGKDIKLKWGKYPGIITISAKDVKAFNAGKDVVAIDHNGDEIWMSKKKHGKDIKIVNEVNSDKDTIKDGLKYAKKKYKYTANQMKELAKEMLQHIKSGEIDDQASMEAYIDFYNDGMMEGSFKGSIAQDARGLGLKTLSDLTKITDRKKVQKIQNNFVKFSMTNKNKYKDWYTAWRAYWDQNKLREIIREVVRNVLLEKTMFTDSTIEALKKVKNGHDEEKYAVSNYLFTKRGKKIKFFYNLARGDDSQVKKVVDAFNKKYKPYKIQFHDMKDIVDWAWKEGKIETDDYVLEKLSGGNGFQLIFK